MRDINEAFNRSAARQSTKNARLYFETCTLLGVVGSKISDRIAALTLLDLPARHIGVDKEIRFWDN